MADLAPRARALDHDALLDRRPGDGAARGLPALNHAVHGAQLAGLWGLRELTPHFGALDDAILGVPYARNFYDSDQRPAPRDPRALAAARCSSSTAEQRSARAGPGGARARPAGPQSELVVTAESHFMVFAGGRRDRGHDRGVPRARRSRRGDDARPGRTGRIAAAAAPFDPRALPKLSGLPVARLGARSCRAGHVRQRRPDLRRRGAAGRDRAARASCRSPSPASSGSSSAT